MTDLALFVSSLFVVAILTVIYHAIAYWLEHKDECSHTWSTWNDPVKDDGHPYQLRHCTKCNLWQSRIIK